MTIKSRGGVFGRNPTFNDVDVDGTLTVGGNAVPDASTILVDGDIGSTVQAYDADTAKLDVAQTFTQDQTFSGENSAVKITGTTDADLRITTGKLSGDFGSVFFGDEDYPSEGRITYQNFDDAMRIWTNRALAILIDNNGNVELDKGNLVIGTSGKGIDFSATSGTGTSELLDDYEEGEVDSLAFETTNSDINVTLDRDSGRYVKVGKQVTVTGALRTSAVTSKGTGSLIVTGLPFTVDNLETRGEAVGAFNGFYRWVNSPALCKAVSNTTTLALIRNSGSGQTNPTPSSDLWDLSYPSNWCYFTITYFTP